MKTIRDFVHRGFRCTSVLLLSAILLPAGCGGPATQTPGRPNILFILLDDVRWDDLGASGHAWVQTPHFDRIAHEGAMFRNSFCATPLCSPNRGSILTGQYAHTHGIIDNVDHSPRSHELMTFPRLLHEAGYATAYIGKWHMGVDDSPRPGFDYWYSLQGQGYHFDPDVNENGQQHKETGFTTDLFTEKAVAFVTEQRDRPFVLYLAHKVVHPNIFQYADGSVSGPDTFTPAERHKHLYEGLAIPRRPNTQYYATDKPALQRPIPGVPPLGPETGTKDAVIRDRLRMLAAADDGMGRLFDALEHTGQLDNTVIVMTSDNGYFYGEHGLDEERRLAYEESILMPLYVRYPPLVKAGATVAPLTVSVDLAPTFLELAGVPEPPGMHGRSLVPLLKGEKPSGWRSSVLIEYYSDKVMPRLVTMGYKAVRTGRWKYIHYVDLDGMDELYDLAEDPYEINNIIGDPQAQDSLAALRQELQRLLNETGPVAY